MQVKLSRVKELIMEATVKRFEGGSTIGNPPLWGGFLLFNFCLLICVTPLAGAQTESSNEPSTNARTQWVWQNPRPQGNPLHGVSFVQTNHGTAVGDYGTIVRTTDGGRTWTKQSSGTSSGLYGVSFVNANNGTAVGNNGIILKTT